MTAELPNPADRPPPRARMKRPRRPASVRDMPVVQPVSRHPDEDPGGIEPVRYLDGVLLHRNDTTMWATSLWPLTGMWVRKHGTKRWRKLRDRGQTFAWLRWVMDGDHEVDPEARPSRAERLAWEDVPEDVATFVREGCSEEAIWAGLELLSRFPAARELANDVPLLAGRLAERCRSRRGGDTWRRVAELLAPLPGMTGWRDLAGALQLDSSRAFVDLLRRMPPAYWGDWSARHALDVVWAHPLARKRLLHARAPSLNAVLVLHAAVDLDCVEALHPSLLDDDDMREGYTMLPDNLRRMVPAWMELHPRRRFPTLRSPDDMYRLMARLRGESRARYGLPAVDEATSLRPLPPPPLPESPAIRPLTSGEELDAEGRALGHCLGNGTWERSARARLGYAYAVELDGQRASLWLERDESGPNAFRIGEFKGPRNSAPAPTVRAAVVAWLEQHTRALAGGTLTLPEEWTRPPFSQDPARFEGIPQPLRWAFGDEDTLPF